MNGFQLPAWDKVFVPDGSLIESFARGSLVFFAVFALFRVVLKRQRGSIGLGDFMLLLLVSEAVSQSLNASLTSVPNGLAAASALLLWTYVIDRACYRWRWAQKVFQSEPVQLVRDGRPLADNMRKELIDDAELASLLRQNGHEDLSRVKAVYIEPEGHVSVVEGRPDPADGPEPPETPDTPPDFEAAMRRFLDAAHRLHRAAAWHDERAAEHKRHAVEAREALKRFGVQPRALLTADGRVETNGSHHPDAPAPE